jgi:two-component system, sporulation sensor kinase D
MQFSEGKNVSKWIIVFGSFTIVALILWNTYSFFQIFKEDERMKMELWAEAQKTLQNADSNVDLELILFVLNNNKNIPLILTTPDDQIYDARNLTFDIQENPEAAAALLAQFKKQNAPITIPLDEGDYRYLYYGNSSLLNTLKYYPIALLLIIFLFALLIFNYYRTSKFATQNKLWAGMAKETAHQIGTPLSSLMGWVEFMKSEAIDPMMVTEIQKDISRLQTITDRFSKIGSEPVLENTDLVSETQKTFDYLKSRYSKQVKFHIETIENPILVSINPSLHSWTIENLIKNAVDAMKGKGTLLLKIEDDSDYVFIKVKDSGKGIPKKLFKQIFDPGFTTKKRGWGLGLSLTKRIVEDYHKGQIKVLQSELNKGTTMQIRYQKLKS